ncbi:uncharacterized protein LOC114241233 isoform X2 [Bombyx mandarina]|uniref:Uncharacterized protein LOC114241233 isoform X2 n=1 Tax=Bombyx mandarina TaxID=7092 RepID=A0A6J2JH90_BOMMA|nr:uncharacterized protein LOC114241233 isoform X2 [Bombyx mandarina]
MKYFVTNIRKTMKMLIFSAMLIPRLLANLQCSDEASSVSRYHLTEKCHRSKLGIVAYANYTSLTSCQRLGLEKKGLAINFSPPEARKVGMEHSCEVMNCAETDGGLSLKNDTRYDYYTLYARPVPDKNSTCVPTIGMFRLLPQKLNYTEAVEQCRNISGVLADITTDQRTDSLGQLLAGSGNEAAFVGLRRSNGSVFKNSRGTTLDCITYRAWAPGHPRRNSTKFECVLISRQKTWLSSACSKRYPALCELNPGGPYKKGSIFTSEKRNGTMIDKKN